MTAMTQHTRRASPRLPTAAYLAAASLVLGAARLLYRMKLIRGDGLLAALRCSNRLSRATMETWRRRRSPLSSRPGR
ncbi:hypothetical protein C5708_09400 [Caulobacter sp. CCUG 60055]|uniref:hypothetical protein n=1 Tax=Caulobacter sp. CCUG 60055 TaxID=2100090 RepID=UPI001FA7BE7F|nr:hypothetical protein [Caulobacter sp. CCUG 60055]MBQ1544073.1 hypothetical protein [Caulobacteraceae bacterium]MCI3180469.1 hypothetical protein [Caulobacter sp. CCUG 60055]